MKDSGAELLLGDFSGNGNEQVPMGGKNSSSKLQKRQGPFLIAGTPINLRYHTRVRTCTLGFAVRRVGDRGPFPHGYLTAGSCSSNRAISNRDLAFVVNNAKEINVGKMSSTNQRSYVPENGLDYAIMKVEDNY